MLTGQIKSPADFPADDRRRMLPRFHPENFDVNMTLVKELEKIAAKKGCTSAQLALGWLLSLSEKSGMPKIIPIPGATTVERVKENASAVRLTDVEMKEIDGILARCPPMGERYPDFLMKYADA